MAHIRAHPGELLREFLPASMTITEAARRLGISRVQLSRILNGKSAISAEMAIRIGRLTSTTAESWLAGQTKWRLTQASRARRPSIRALQRPSAQTQRPGNAVRKKLAKLGITSRDVSEAVRWARQSKELPRFTHEDLVKALRKTRKEREIDLGPARGNELL